MSNIFIFFFTTIVDICSLEVFQYMIGISFVLCLIGIVSNRL